MPRGIFALYSLYMVQSSYLQSKVHVWRIATFAAFLTLSVAWACVGDQLQWNTLCACNAAAKVIAAQPFLISYCSQADNDHVELWLVRDQEIAATSVPGFYEVIVSARSLYRSDRMYSSSEFPISDDQWSFGEVKDASWFNKGIDLAYVYIHLGGGSFRCLGRVLGVDCTVGVEILHLPDDLMEQFAGAREVEHYALPWSLDVPSARSPFTSR